MEVSGINSEDKPTQNVQKLMSDIAIERAFPEICAHALKEAHPKATKEQILRDVGYRSLTYLGIEASVLTPPKSMKINEHVMSILTSLVNNEFKTTSPGKGNSNNDDLNLFAQIQAGSFVLIYDVTKFIQMLSKRLSKKRPDSMEQILKNNELNIALGVDGFHGILPSDCKSYVENLQYGPGEISHLDSVRNMYKDDLLKDLNGTDSAAIVQKAILKVFREYHTTESMQLTIDSVVGKLSSILDKNSDHYASVKENGEKCLEKIMKYYKENTKDIEEIAAKKCKILQESETKKRKREKNDSNGKSGNRGRPKNSTPKETDEESEKKRPRTVKPPKPDNEDGEDDQ